MSSNQHIKQATVADLSQLHAIESSAHVSPWSELMLRDSLTGGHLCWKLTDTEGLLGFMVVMPVMDQLELLNIAISPLQQGNGLGKRLMKHLLQYADDNQLSSIFLEVRSSNQAALRLYENLGFEQIGFRENYYHDADGREDALVMQLSR